MLLLWVVIRPYDHPPANRSLRRGVLMMVLRRHRSVVLGHDFAPTSLAPVDGGEWGNSPRAVKLIERSVLVHNQEDWVFIGGHTNLSTAPTPTCTDSLLCDRRTPSGGQLSRPSQASFRGAQLAEGNSVLVPAIGRSRRGLAGSFLNDLMGQAVCIPWALSCSCRHATVLRYALLFCKSQNFQLTT